MRKTAVIIAAATFALSVPLVSFAMDHESMPMDQGSMKMEHREHGRHTMGKVVHVEVVDGVKATFSVLDIKAKMAEMGMKETHHIMVIFNDVKTGKALTEGDVKVKVMSPNKTEQVKELMGMEDGFGADFALPQKGKYGVMTKFKLADGKIRTSKFWYNVK